MTITEHRQGAVTVVRLEGPLIDPHSQELQRRLVGIASASLGRFVLDLSAVPFVDSTGLEVLVSATDNLADSGQTLKLAATSRTVREVLELTDLASMFEHFDDVTNAVRSFL